jgi:hypothetical protein
MERITQRQSAVKDPRGSFSEKKSASHQKFDCEDLSPTERRLLLTSTLGLYLRRARHGIPLLRSDLVRLEVYADVDPPAAEEAAA